MQRLEPGYYEKDFDALAYELSQLSPDSEELIMESVAEQRTAVLEVLLKTHSLPSSKRSSGDFPF
jgi:hypothetical protein